MLVAKDPNLEKQLQVPLRENLGEIRERCLEDLKHFISELDEAVRQPEPSVCDSTTPSAALMGHKPLKPGVNHSSSYWQRWPALPRLRLRMARQTAKQNGYVGQDLDCWIELVHSPATWRPTLRECSVALWGQTVLVWNGLFVPLLKDNNYTFSVLFSNTGNKSYLKTIPVSHHYKNG